MSEPKTVDITKNQSKVNPICQAEDCEKAAIYSVSSQKGHPHNEWKLCPTHYDEVNGKDPWYDEERQWTLRKLYYRCPNGGKISHNSIQKYEDEGGYPCSCGERHLAQTVENKE